MKFWFRLLIRITTALLKWIPCVGNNFLVLSSGRSGSTLLTEYLRCHQSISCSVIEPLNPDTNGLTNARINPYALIYSVMTWLISRRSFSGCKIFCQQLEYYRIPFAELLAALRDPPVIVLYRESLLETYVSLQIAFKTNVWYTADDSSRCTNISIDFEEYRHHAETERQRWKNTLSALTGSRSKNRVHFLSYEELSANKKESMTRLFAFLHLPPCETEAYCKRQNPFRLSETISNYEEIKEKLNSFRGHILTREWMKECLSPK